MFSHPMWGNDFPHGDGAWPDTLAQEDLADALLVDAVSAFEGMQFRAGACVAADRHLARWFRHARSWPVQV